jgi:hypothetical protein
MRIPVWIAGPARLYAPTTPFSWGGWRPHRLFGGIPRRRPIFPQRARQHRRSLPGSLANSLVFNRSIRAAASWGRSLIFSEGREGTAEDEAKVAADGEVVETEGVFRFHENFDRARNHLSGQAGGTVGVELKSRFVLAPLKTA